MTHAFEFGRTAEGPDSAEIKKAAQTLVEVIKGAKVEEFISAIEWLKWLVERIDRSSILNFRGQSGCSLLHVAVASSKDDILQLLLFDADDQLIATQNDWGDTPFHTAAKTGNSKAVEILIRRARKPLNDKRENQILTMKNKHGNTALHEAVLNRHVNVVSLLLKEDLEPVYLENEAKKSPLYLALDTGNSEILEILLSYSPEPSKIKGLPPVHGALVRPDYGKNLNLYVGNIYVCVN
ncbi:hypothetical protein EUGRSUZ_K00681 [Eucalyptus grandis]|uniref:Uncharacterized protein n=2 Tax=Eucalyptus grandis TaxID=71139 RepID=A0ACC3IR26_EUCGR|nr:hypothetical protein EUGRSUZ_K00681 [Eucalyptus grandis]